MHHIYHTRGLVLGSKSFGEASKYYYLFTRDLGMLYVTAQGVRKMSSKLRFVLQDFSYIKVDVVQGRDFWRVTSASKTNELENIVKSVEVLKIFGNIARLLRRLLAGVEPNEFLFDDVLHGLSLLERVSMDSADANSDYKRTLEDIEVIIVLRILHNLGYIGGGDTLKDLTKSPFEEELLYKIPKTRKDLLKEINKALKETHL